jgi:hypothetical protein
MIIIVIQMEMTYEHEELEHMDTNFSTPDEKGVKFFLFLIIYGPFVSMIIYPVIDIVTILQS